MQQRNSKLGPLRTQTELLIGSLLAALLLIPTGAGWLPLTLIEALGFVTGAACVYLVLRESVWNFPLGIANNLVFLVLFYQSRLYGDSGLQAVYVLLAVHGWWSWLRGGQNHKPLHIRQVGRWEATAVAAATAVNIPLLMVALKAVGAAAPVLDSATTVLSLAAQYLLNRKFVENWYVWIVADILYIYLYTKRELYLTATLYAVFLLMCLYGLRRWRQLMTDNQKDRRWNESGTEFEGAPLPTCSAPRSER